MDTVLAFLLGVTITTSVIFGILLKKSTKREENLRRCLGTQRDNLERSHNEISYTRGKEVGRTSDHIYRKIQRDVESGNRVPTQLR